VILPSSGLLINSDSKLILAVDNAMIFSFLVTLASILFLTQLDMNAITPNESDAIPRGRPTGVKTLDARM